MEGSRGLSSLAANIVALPWEEAERHVASDKFCPCCQPFYDDFVRIVNKWSKDDNSPLTYPFQSSLPKLRESIDFYGCKICRIFNQALIDHDYFYHEVFDSNAKTRPHLWFQPCNGPYYYGWLRLRGGSVKPSGMAILKDLSQVHSPVEEDFDSHVNGMDRPTNIYPTSIQLTRRWLDECRASHKTCKALQTPPDHFVVTRLLHISPDAKSLCIKDHLPSDTQYATLSHCWGKLDILRLTKATLENFHLAIPLEKLCKTFQDAILVTRGVGLEYLWIDSLCIIQDDEEDWLAESALMGSIYNGSSLNIAAVSAKDGNGGLYLPTPNTLERARASRFKVSINGHLESFHFIDSRTYTRCVTKGALVSRGWTVQERILSPRIIYFSKSEAFWECTEKSASETLPDGFPEFLLGVLGYLKPTQKLAWPDIVRVYSGTNLTNARDKLIALSGVAEHLQKSTHDRYLAGLWLRDLIHTLGWTTSNRSTQHARLKPRPAVYRAPTWSWASTDNQISFPDHEPNGRFLHHCVSLLDYHIDASTEYQLGEVTGASLTLSCEVLLQCKFRPWDKGDIYSRSVLLGDSEVMGRMDWDCDFGVQPREYFFIVTEMSERADRLFRMKGLVVCRSSNVKGQYERYGHFSVRKTILQWGEVFSRIKNEVPAEENYVKIVLSHHGRRKYVITII